MAKNYEAVLAIVDKYSAPILKMEEKLRALGEVGEKTNKMLTPHQKLFSNVMADLGELGVRFGEVGKSIGEMSARITEMLGPLATIGAVGSLAGVVEMTHRFAEATEQLVIGAKIAGISVQAMQALNYAALQTGVSTDSLQHGLGMLNKNLALGAGGRDKDLVALMHHLHIAMIGANGQVLSGVQLLPKLADAFQLTTDPAIRALMAQELFGRSGMELLPLLNQGSAALDDYTAAFQKYGYTLSAQDVSGAEKFNESWKNMQTAIGGLTDDISAKLAPVLTPVINQIADWTAKNRNWIASGLQGAMQGVVTSLQKIDFKAVLVSMEKFGADTWNVVNALGGMKTVMLVIGGATIAPFVASMIAVTESVASLGWALGGPVIMSLVELGSTLIDVIPMIDSMSAAMAAFDLVLDANPIGLIVLAVAALGAGAYELYEHWDWVKDKLSETWKTIEKDLEQAFLPNKAVMAELNAAALGFSSEWTSVQSKLSGVWKTIDSDFNAVFGPILQTIDKVETALNSLDGPQGGAAYTGPRSSRQALLTGGNSPAPIRAPVLVGDPPNAQAQPGNTTITVNLPNHPPGTTVNAKAYGSAPMPKISTGRSSMAGGAE